MDQLDIKVLKPDIPKYIEGHQDTLTLKKKLAESSEKIEFLKSIIENIKGRSFIIRDAIEWAKYTSGS